MQRFIFYIYLIKEVVDRCNVSHKVKIPRQEQRTKFSEGKRNKKTKAIMTQREPLKNPWHVLQRNENSW